jgi:hypothetical protein
MAERRRGLAALAVVAVAGAGVAAGVFLTRGTAGDADASPTASSAGSSTASPTPSVPLGEESGFDDVSTTPTASIGPEPDTGRPVATDEPVAVTGEPVQVAITYAGWDPSRREVQVDGYVAGISEEGGTCTLTLTRGGASVSGSNDGVADAHLTACGALAVPGSEVSAGTWRAVLSYRSAGHSGASESWDVEVPQ